MFGIRRLERKIEELRDVVASIRCDLDRMLHFLEVQGEHVMASLTAITAEVARNTEVDASVLALVEGLAAQIEAIKTDPVALQALADQLRADNDKVAAAVVAHTPAQP